MIVITAAYFLLMMVLSVSGFCDMDATGAIPPSEADNIPIEQCEFYIDLHGWPYYLTNPNNCSQFWECTVAGDICLYECQHCSTPSLCPETGALYFNPELQYPLGPACDWPSNIECTNPWMTTTTTPSCPLPCQHWDHGKCRPECCSDPDCTDPSKPICNANGLCQDGCRYMTDCDGSNIICHEPWAQDPNNCEYCGNMNGDGIGECLPGCIDNPDLCPQGFHCDGNHKCVSDCVYPCCTKGEDCNNYNAICQLPATNPPNQPSCEYCTSDGTSPGECKPGCEPSQNMCPQDHVSCNPDTHECEAVGGLAIRLIVVKTKKCEGCSETNIEGGAIANVISGVHNCTTNNLDHLNERDYADGHPATFDSHQEADRDPLGRCYGGKLSSRDQMVKIRWDGPEESKWSPDKITIQSTEPLDYECVPTTEIVLGKGETAEIKCV